VFSRGCYEFSVAVHLLFGSISSCTSACRSRLNSSMNWLPTCQAVLAATKIIDVAIDERLCLKNCFKPVIMPR